MSPTLPLALLLASGCSQDTRVVGGTESQRALAETVLDETLSSTSVDLSIPTIRIRPSFDRGGRYNTVTRSITLDGSLDDDRLVTTLRHELCHALDLQGDFRSKDHDAWLPSRSEGYGGHTGLREGFARMCSFGADFVAMVHGCDDLPISAPQR